MHIFDTPIPRISRTPRELLLLGIVGYGAYLSYGFWPEFITAVGVALLFALRVPQARPIAVGFCLGWLVSMAAMMGQAHNWDLSNMRVIMPGVLLLLLTSRDLFERFDAAPARFLPNVWRELPVRHWRMMRWDAYSLGVLAALVVPGWLWASTQWALSASTPSWVLGGIVLALALLVIGSSLGFVIASATAGFTLAHLGPKLLDEAAYTPGLRPGMLGPICAASLVVLVLSAPYCLRLFGLGGAKKSSEQDLA